MRPLRGKPPIQRGPVPTLDWAAAAARMRMRPGVWFEVARFASATNAVWRIKTGANPAFREGSWDAVSRMEGGERVLYACYLGDDDAGS